MKNKSYRTFGEFYPFYLSQHENRTNRRFHFLASCLVIMCVLAAIFSQSWLWLLAAPVAGYGSAWIGHFFFEKNKPATFEYPLYSLRGDWVMFWDMLTGKLPL